MFKTDCYEDTILKVTQDQQEALGQFYSSIEKRAYRMVLFETKNSSDAIDLVQDAMEALMKRYKDRPKNEWRPLFYKILQNKITDWQRRSILRNKLFWTPSREEHDDQSIPYDDASSPMKPEEHLNNELSIEKLQSLLVQLSPRQRQTFLLRVWEGFDVKQTAKIMKCSSGSVKTHLSRAMEYLRTELQDEI